MQLSSALQCNVECTILHLHKVDAISLKYFKGFVWEKSSHSQRCPQMCSKRWSGCWGEKLEKARNELQRNVEMDTPPIVISSCCEKTSKGQWEKRKDPKNSYICQSFWPHPPSLFMKIQPRCVKQIFTPSYIQKLFAHSQQIKQEKHGFKNEIKFSFYFWHFFTWNERVLVRHCDTIFPLGGLPLVLTAFQWLQEKQGLTELKFYPVTFPKIIEFLHANGCATFSKA